MKPTPAHLWVDGSFQNWLYWVDEKNCFKNGEMTLFVGGG